MRAERRPGELLREMAESRERDTGTGGDRKSQSQAATVKLSDLDISRMQSLSKAFHSSTGRTCSMYRPLLQSVGRMCPMYRPLLQRPA
jgi:hypothetical protein